MKYYLFCGSVRDAWNDVLVQTRFQSWRTPNLCNTHKYCFFIAYYNKFHAAESFLKFHIPLASQEIPYPKKIQRFIAVFTTSNRVRGLV
jgi:hypothetical protein